MKVPNGFIKVLESLHIKESEVERMLRQKHDCANRIAIKTTEINEYDRKIKTFEKQLAMLQVERENAKTLSEKTRIESNMELLLQEKKGCENLRMKAVGKRKQTLDLLHATEILIEGNTNPLSDEAIEGTMVDIQVQTENESVTNELNKGLESAMNENAGMEAVNTHNSLLSEYDRQNNRQESEVESESETVRQADGSFNADSQSKIMNFN